MVLVATVAKKSASIDVNGIYAVSVNLILTDDAVEILNQDYSQIHNPANNISVARDELLVNIQKTIDDYKANQIVYDSIAFTNAVTYINDNLVV